VGHREEVRRRSSIINVGRKGRWERRSEIGGLQTAGCEPTLLITETNVQVSPSQGVQSIGLNHGASGGEDEAPDEGDETVVGINSNTCWIDMFLIPG